MVKTDQDLLIKQYCKIVGPVLRHPTVQEMRTYPIHGETD